MLRLSCETALRSYLRKQKSKRVFVVSIYGSLPSELSRRELSTAVAQFVRAFLSRVSLGLIGFGDKSAALRKELFHNQENLCLRTKRIL